MFNLLSPEYSGTGVQDSTEDPGRPAEQYFLETFIGLREHRVTNIARAQEGIGKLCSEFAKTMVRLEMPVDRFPHMVRERLSDGRTQVTTTRYAGWPVLDGVNLAGDKLKNVKIGKHGPQSYSLGSGTPNDFRTIWRDATEEELARLQLGYDDWYKYRKLGVIVSSQGVPMVVSASGFKMGNNSKRRFVVPPYTVKTPFATAHDLLGDYSSGKPSPDVFIDQMREHMTAAFEEYERQRNGQTWEDLKRPLGYYDPISDTRFVDDSRAQPRGFLRRLLRRG